MDEDVAQRRLFVHVHGLMQPEVLETFPEERLAEAAARIRGHQVGSLMVVEDEELIGIVSERGTFSWRSPKGSRPSRRP